MSSDNFLSRHIGPRMTDIDEMLSKVGVNSIDDLIDQTIPSDIRMNVPLQLSEPMTEYAYLKYIKGIASKNKINTSHIGLGYYNTITPSVILRNIFENPSWYTSYTPYQAEISQGRLEALLNYQTMIMSLTGMEIANCSLLDESTAAAESIIMMYNKRDRFFTKNEGNTLFVDEKIFPQTLDVLITRAEPLGIEIVVGDYKTFEFTDKVFGSIVQYPNSDGSIEDYAAFSKKAHSNKSMISVIADLMSLAILVPPGEWGADIVCGTTQRFGIPMGYGGPHAAYFATSDKLKRSMPGRIIGVSVDKNGNPALRMALQTREQHIKRERATSNICTAQALLATMAGMYAVYHGPQGIKEIAHYIHNLTGLLNNGLAKIGIEQSNKDFFDTLKIVGHDAKAALEKGHNNNLNFRLINDNTIGISLDETNTLDDVNAILSVLCSCNGKEFTPIEPNSGMVFFNEVYLRNSPILEEKIFSSYHSETEMMRYIKKLERKDFSLTHSMISLGSCTMKLNPATTMLPLSWPEFGSIHPFAPKDQAEGYQILIKELEDDLAEITGFAAVSLQPNSGAAGEYTGLMVIREYHKSRGEGHRNIVLIPASAHGTNPASAVMAGGKVVVVACDEKGNVDITDLKAKAEEHKANLHSYMITYPSTHGVFEKEIREMMNIIHQNGGQVYMDGANMNAQVGLTSPGIIGADVCHLNLHKTFAIPHGGGGPGVGPIGVAEHLKPYLPSHSVIATGGDKAIKAVSAAPYGSAFVLPITHAYIKMLGGEGLTSSTKMAILNANYLAQGIKEHYGILYSGDNGRVGHEMIVDCRHFRQEYGIETSDIAKRLMDYGFHAPTLSFPVPETLMVEPTESESKEELDRFIEAMASIMEEILEIKAGTANAEDNLLKNAPHTAIECTDDNWDHTYSRHRAAYPLDWSTFNKFWPSVARVDNGYGDRNLVCSCAPISEYQ
ncbi:MAG: aminomethyl-transferring glycine dehydrogenase [Salinivirgaceae bacterium]|jgi:glycine dehydrogenase|nr:aminomethyl-transferring glycine dehydrogenase [Salinivirgaceae bacterium]